MIVKNNYDECLTNIACSVRKYFNLPYKHKTFKYIDEILEKKQPKNIVIILYDGMGSRILDRVLDRNSFLIKNKYKEITSVFPATTTAATTSIRTGYNPVEHGWLGWDTYINALEKTITLFRETEKGKDKPCRQFLEYKEKFKPHFIADEVNEKGNIAKEIFPFKIENGIVYNDLDDMLNKIKIETDKEGKKFIYAYDPEPDHTMHEYGSDSKEVKVLIEERNQKTEELVNKLKDTLVIILADHGHIKVDNIFLKDYPKILQMQERTISLEQRTISFKIKEKYKDIFPKKFEEKFGKWFKLYEKEDVIKSKLFGDGKESPIFKDAIGDFIAIAENSNKTIISEGDDILLSQHAGYTDDEIYVPLIIIEKD